MRRKNESIEEDKSKIQSRLKICEGKSRKIEEDLLKEQKKSGKLEFEKSEMSTKIKKQPTKISQETHQRTKSTNTSNSSVLYLERELFKKDIELSKLREIVKHNTFGFNQKFEVNSEFRKFFPMSGLRSENNEIDNLLEIMQRNKNWGKEIFEENQLLKKLLVSLFGLFCGKRGVISDLQIMRTINGPSFLKTSAEKVYDAFYKML